METEKTELVAKFKQGGVELTETDLITKVKTIKLVDYNSFFEAINKNVVLQTGLVPPGTRYFMRYQGSAIIFLEEPPRIEELTLHIKAGGSKDENHIVAKIPVPGLLFGISLKEGSGIHSANVWALKNPIRDVKDVIYDMPLGNSFGSRGSHGNFCWGTTTDVWKNIKEVYQVRSIVNLFYTSTFNTDLAPRFIGGTYDEHKVENLTDLWKYIKNQKEFPTGLLLKAGTVKQMIEDMGGGNDLE